MDIPWPQKGDKAFEESPKACFMDTHRAGPHELAIMAKGYKTASDILVQHLAQHGRNDGLVYPILFGYRQYLELRIKALVVLVNRAMVLDYTPYTCNYTRLGPTEPDYTSSGIKKPRFFRGFSLLAALGNRCSIP